MLGKLRNGLTPQLADTQIDCLDDVGVVLEMGGTCLVIGTAERQIDKIPGPVGPVRHSSIEVLCVWVGVDRLRVKPRFFFDLVGPDGDIRESVTGS